MVTSADGAASEMSRTNASRGDMCNITILNGTLLTGKENINTDLKLACRDHVMNLPSARTNIGCFPQSHIEKPLLCIKKNQEDEVKYYHENNVMFERKGCSQLIPSSMPHSMVRNKIMKSGKDFPNSLASGGAVFSNLENPLELRLGLSLVSQVSGVPDKKLNSVDSAIRGSYASQVQYRLRTYTKVYMRGRVGRSIDIERYSGYHELRKYLARVFGLEGQLEDRYRIGAKLVYVDHENDILLFGDDPWEEFVSCVQAIKILSPQEVQQLSLDEDFPDSVFPNEVNGNSNGLYPPLPYSFNVKSTPISGSRSTGSIMGIRDLNPAGWNTLNWPKFQVGCGLKRPRQPQMLDYDFSHLDSPCKKIIPLLGDDFAMMDDQALHSLHSVMQMNMHQSLSLANSTEPNYLHSLSCSLLKYRTGGGLSCHLGVSHQENNLHLSAQRSTTSLLLDQLQKSHAVSPCLSSSSSSSCISRFRKLLRKATYKSESASVNQVVAGHAKDRKKVGGRKSTGKAHLKLSTDAQRIAARERRDRRIRERIKILQSLVPGGSKMDGVSMLEEAIHYVKFLKTQIWLYQSMINVADTDPNLLLFPNYNLSPEQSTSDLYARATNMVAEAHSLPQMGFPPSASSSYEEILAMPFGAKMHY